MRLFLLAVSVQAICREKYRNCGECIEESVDCHWCEDENFDGSRCVDKSSSAICKSWIVKVSEKATEESNRKQGETTNMLNKFCMLSKQPSVSKSISYTWTFSYHTGCTANVKRTKMTPQLQTRQHWLTMAPALGLNVPQKNTKRTTRTRINTKTKRQIRKLAQNPCPRSHYRGSKVICFLLDQLMSTSGR